MDADELLESRLTDDADVYRVDCDGDESVVEGVVRGIATMRDTETADLDSLYEHVDTVALEAIVRHANERDEPVSVRFAVDEYTVCVSSDGTIRIASQ